MCTQGLVGISEEKRTLSRPRLRWFFKEYQSLSFSAEVKNEYRYTSIPPICSGHGQRKYLLFIGIEIFLPA
jgi:hypothetical protein